VSNQVVAPGFNAIALKVESESVPADDFRSLGISLGCTGASIPVTLPLNGSANGGNSGKGLKNRYLGLRFFINGKLHYRWARVSVFINGGSFSPPPFLTGYAYETIPGKSIIAGQTKGPDDGTMVLNQLLQA
jgi:hypothetical protein